MRCCIWIFNRRQRVKEEGGGKRRGKELTALSQLILKAYIYWLRFFDRRKLGLKMNLKVSPPLSFLVRDSPCCVQSRWGNQLMNMLSVKDVYSSQNQRPADKFEGSCWHNRTVGRCAFVHVHVHLKQCLPTCTQVVASMCILIQKHTKSVLCESVCWCVCALFRVPIWENKKATATSRAEGKNVILFDMPKSSLIFSCLFESSRDMDWEGKISRA